MKKKGRLAVTAVEEGEKPLHPLRHALPAQLTVRNSTKRRMFYTGGLSAVHTIS
jgi:hypothetical protein